MNQYNHKLNIVKSKIIQRELTKGLKIIAYSAASFV